MYIIIIIINGINIISYYYYHYQKTNVNTEYQPQKRDSIKED